MATIHKWTLDQGNNEWYRDLTQLLAEYMQEKHLSRFDIDSLFSFKERMVPSFAGGYVLYNNYEPIACGLVEGIFGRETRPYAHEISRMYVKPIFRGLGLGERLMTRMTDDLASQGLSHAFLVVSKDNHSAQKFYEKQEFIECPISGDASSNVFYMHKPLKLQVSLDS